MDACCRRNIQGAGEDDVDIPSATNTALTWAFFMGTSANVRYQVLHSSALQGDEQSCARTCASCGEG